MRHAKETAGLARTGLETYVIQHGKEDAPRLNVLAPALAPSTGALLDRLMPLETLTIVDAACGGGDVTVELSRRVGAGGRVVGLDADPGKLEAARGHAAGTAFDNIKFVRCDVTEPWPVRDADMVYARFILTHLRQPETLLASAWNALKPGGLMVVEDIDTDGVFCHPASEAVTKCRTLYSTVTQMRGCDPCIGRRLDLLLEDSGFRDVGGTMAHPYARKGPAKDVMVMTIHAIADSAISAGLLPGDAMRSLLRELDAFAARPDTTIGMPRVFQAWGRKA